MKLNFALCTASYALYRNKLTRLALTSVLGLFGNSFYPPRCIDALFGSKSSPEGNPDSSPPVQRPVHGTERPRPSSIYPMTDNVCSLGTLSACRSFETKDHNGDISESVRCA